MTKSFKALWDLFLFRDKGILPTQRLLLLMVVVSVLSTALAALGTSWFTLLAMNLGVLVVSLFDLGLSPSKKQWQIHREIEEEVERGLESEMTVSFYNPSDYEADIQVIDQFPTSFSNPFPIRERIPSDKKVTLSIPYVAKERGDYTLESLFVRYRSKYGLWEKQMKVNEESRLRVIPDLTESRQFLEDAQRYLLYEGSRVRKRKQGSGEFSKIRNYVVGDDLRLINWRQTAKLQELMTNEYEPEHGKYITLMIDCGRMMGVSLEKGNRLDRALEAAVTVATAALKKGDAVSVIAFSREVEVYIPPAKGMQHLQTILQQVYSLKASQAESNYSALFQKIETAQKKRSLLLLFSDVNTLVHEEGNMFYLQRLRRKHMFLMLGIEDQTTIQKGKQFPGTTKEAIVKSMAQKQQMDKTKEVRKWEKQGIQMIEAPEDRLAVTAVTRYIDILNQGLI
ncbi:DUF58 domain-containing protein [Halobacillus litoralis]|uniref:DUF58 domain-containing protein n=1 Tax=Halobacillus litoralis TaxID=45668 RepID=UPI001CD5A3C8|nr:DUF58 domain-containing protein [Halobacillus litoralis]MCA0971300.1 DUF58 domain-containing protein [Halobacillus litoralis]